MTRLEAELRVGTATGNAAAGAAAQVRGYQPAAGRRPDAGRGGPGQVRADPIAHVQDRPEQNPGQARRGPPSPPAFPPNSGP